MFKYQSLDGVDFGSKMPWEDFIETVDAIGGYTKQLEGYSVENREIYSYTLGNPTIQPTIFIDANIHGDHEWRSSIWVREFMKILVEPYNSAVSTKIKELATKYAFVFVPTLNPDGWVSGTYWNANGVSIHLNFDYKFEEYPILERPSFKGDEVWSEPEARIVRDIVLRDKPISYVNCHTWGGEAGLKVRQAENDSHTLVILDYLKSMGITCDIDVGEATLPRLDAPTSYNWVSTQQDKGGRPILSHVLETGLPTGGANHYEQSFLGINGLFAHCVYVDNYYTENKLIVTEV